MTGQGHPRGHGERWQGRLCRPVAGHRGMVATAHPLATLAGVEILRAGGNAVDAAIAAAAVTAVVLPQMCGLGGDCFMLVYRAARKEAFAIAGAGPVPKAASVEEYRRRGYREMPLTGMLAVSVPGAVDAWAKALEAAGTLPLARLLEPAVTWAEDGFVVTPSLEADIGVEKDKLSADEASREVFLPGGEVPRAGSILRQPDLARSLRRLGERPRDLYEGGLASQLVEHSRRLGGLFTPDDLAGYHTQIEAPLAGSYRGHTVLQTPPPSQGFILLEELNILQGFDLARLGPGTDGIHLMVEAKKLAFADRLRYAGDPRQVPFPLGRLLSKEYAERRRAEIDLALARPGWYPGGGGGETTYLAVVDGEGNAVSLIHSISLAFGAGVTIPGTGIVLNNRAGRGFTLQEGHPNCLAPGKRTIHTLNCFLVLREGELWLVGGSPGGDGQPQWNMQMLVALLDWGLSPAEAVELPRWTSHPGTDPASWRDVEVLLVEDRLDAKVREELRARGHRVQTVGPWEGGGAAQLICRMVDTGTLVGVSDPRAEGLALGI